MNPPGEKRTKLISGTWRLQKGTLPTASKKRNQQGGDANRVHNFGKKKTIPDGERPCRKGQLEDERYATHRRGLPNANQGKKKKSSALMGQKVDGERRGGKKRTSDKAEEKKALRSRGKKGCPLKSRRRRPEEKKIRL